ncbi:MAG: GFA family protein [Gammaproteobacteria bacterium]|nr:GFA family protein [Gammaproteobacteria bacterium]NNL51817.1 GFA family protein [Woeseiaceae bacterium]
MLHGSCHCGAVRIEVARRPRSLTQCTCSICRRYGAQWAYYSRKTATISCNPDDVTAYVWGDKTLEFFHCNRCGCLTHYESVDKEDDSRIAVNARMISPADMADVKLRLFDGAETWKYLDRA